MNIARRPSWPLIVLALLVIYHIVDMIRVLRFPAEFADSLSLPVPLRLMTGVTWGLLFAWSMLDVVKRNPASVNRARYLLVLFVLYSVVRLLIFTEADYDRQRLPFIIAVLIVLLIIIGLVRWIRVRLRRRHQKDGEKIL